MVLSAVARLGSGAGGLLATGRKASPTLPVGTHTIVLEVEDARGSVAHDTIVVEVKPPKQ